MGESPQSIQDRFQFRDVWSVSRLNREARMRLEIAFPLLWIEGEISNLARPSSGHFYFSLKDADAQVRCAMFRNRNQHLGFAPENGAHVLLRARISLYEARGEYQLIVEHMEEAGDGALRRAFEALKQRLEREGLFDPAHKQALPAVPRCVGVVTSPTGAAIRDVLTTLKRRFPALPVVLYPVPVQGTGAATQIARAIRTAAARAECDVLILTRGGGSLEDLWAFNEEPVARAIYDCALPVVSAVGHEIDFTIADFVADCRCPTPTAAAEQVSPDQAEWSMRLSGLHRRLTARMRQRLQAQGQTLGGLEKRLRHPGRRLEDISQRLDELELRMRRALRSARRHAEARLATARARLQRHSPAQRVSQYRARYEDRSRRLHTAFAHGQTGRRARLQAVARELDAVSPLATLGRGYAIVRRLPDGAVVRTANEVQRGQTIEARLGHGRLLCRVDDTVEDE